jgi:C_GCAxxG_C_C family probable redox protein
MDELSYRILNLTNKGYCCSQIMLKLALEEEEKENPDLIRAVNGLCNGIGNEQKTCGVLTGGIGILGLYAGKGEDQDYAKTGYSSMIRQFIEWFESEFNSLDCSDLIGFTKFTDDHDQSYLMKCGNILTKSYFKIRQILEEYGYEFGDRDD